MENVVSQTVSKARIQRLQKFSNAAIEYQKRKDIFRTALCLQVIQNEKLYLESDYDNMSKFSTSLLGLTKGTISNYLNIAKKFLDSKTGTSIFASDKGDFGYLQLVELKKLSVDEAKDIVSRGIINYNTPAKEVKQAVSDFKAQIQQDTAKAKEDSIKPIKTAYEAFNTSYNELYELVSGDDICRELLQKIMDSVVVLYNENDRLWN